MNVLDELREEILAERIVCDGCGKPLKTVGEVHENRWVDGDRFPELCGYGIATRLIEPEDVAEAFNAFEAEHPGLIDKTHNCANCGLALPNYYEDGSGGEINNPGWEYVWTFAGPEWREPWGVGDEELWDIWLCCPACAKEAG